MSENYVYFDLETQRSANDVGGWDRKADMKMSVGVTYSSANGSYMIYDESNVQGLIDELVSADVVVGFNHIWFDYEVLMGYTILDLKEQTTNLDLMLELEKVLEHKPKLDAVAAETLGEGKTAVGTDAIKWWQEGRIMDIAEYCCFDVKVTKLVHEYGAQHGIVKYKNRFNQSLEVPVDWKMPAR
ncbi:MAG: helicase [Verrucomicrobiales bacterium]|jgi:DEAD/DEAH box helicase domain-containing protein|nr:helicase [Verrucomicrobiales bacterium]|tara:strand:- start:305 stop:859 length:555 start_codon:yes stop_codon:yes gene_type:complete